MELHPILVAVAFVIQIQGGVPIGSASGFFFQVSGDRFFVTNKHVVAGQPGKNPDTIRLRLHVDAQNLQKNDWLDLSLYNKDGTKKWKEHPTIDVDVALIPLKGVDLSRFVITWIQSTDYLPSDLAFHPGEDVFIIGYPQGFHDSVNNLPVFRNAFIASTYGVPFQGRPLFLTDAKLHPGMSGSPVFTKPKSTWIDTKGNTRIITGVQYYLLGVHSGTVIWPPKEVKKEEKAEEEKNPDPLGLGVAWYANLLDKITTSK